MCATSQDDVLSVTAKLCIPVPMSTTR